MAVVMHLVRVLPRTAIDFGSAQSLLRRWVRFGPTVPLVPAAARVWQVPQPPGPVKTTFPAAAEPVEAEPDEAAPEEAEPEPEAEPDDGAAPPPGMPGCAALGGGVPTGGGPFGFCAPNQALKAVGVTTWTG